MQLLNDILISQYLTNNHKFDENGNMILEPVKYRWTHGATDLHLGDGLMVYSLIQFNRAKICVCIGTGGGFIPRLMTQARKDLWEQKIFEGNNSTEWGDIGTTIIVDASNGIGGFTDWTEENSFLRQHFAPQVIIETSERAYYDYFIRQDIKIDYLHIDAGHSYENVKQDFELYSQLLNTWGIISIHDTDLSYEKEHIVTYDVKSENHQEYSNGPSRFVKELKENSEWEVFNFFNNGILRTKPASTGLTFIQRCKK